MNDQCPALWTPEWNSVWEWLRKNGKKARKDYIWLRKSPLWSIFSTLYSSQNVQGVLVLYLHYKCSNSSSCQMNFNCITCYWFYIHRTSTTISLVLSLITFTNIKQTNTNTYFPPATNTTDFYLWFLPDSLLAMPHPPTASCHNLRFQAFLASKQITCTHMSISSKFWDIPYLYRNLSFG